nr:hypothetical protein [uncultured Sphingosinicella sp.]
MSEAYLHGEARGGKSVAVAGRNRARGLFGLRSPPPCRERPGLFMAAHRHLLERQSNSSASFTART